MHNIPAKEFIKFSADTIKAAPLPFASNWDFPSKSIEDSAGLSNKQTEIYSFFGFG